MIFNLHVPQGQNLAALAPIAPMFFCYVLSFVTVGIYWNNHHHMLHAVRRISGGVLWANLHLLFWLSLLPFVTAWMGFNNLAAIPTALYGIDLFMSGIAYGILTHTLIAADGKDSLLAKAVGSARKETITLVIYFLAIPIAIWNRWVSAAMYVSVAFVWLVPDRRIESMFPPGAK
jgi:uncharacterized membrane protein